MMCAVYLGCRPQLQRIKIRVAVIDPLHALILVFHDSIVREHSREGVLSLEATIDCKVLPIEHSILPRPGLIEAL
jgi:hypothetical protein